MKIITLLSFVSLCTCDEVVNYKPIEDTNGGATTHDWTGEFLDINGNACSGCNYCDGTGLRNIFSIDLDNFCTECSSESTCNKIRIENKFGRGWPIKFIVLTSSNASKAEDPSGMTMHASIDSRTRPWEELQILQFDLQPWDDSDSVVFLPARDKMHTCVLKNYNHEYYKDYALEWTLPAASSTMQVGAYHIDESYLAAYSAQITQEMYGIACFLPSKMKPTPEMMVGIVKDPTTDYVVSFDMHIDGPFTHHGPIVEFKACKYCSWKTYGSRMPSFWSHSARKPDQVQFISSTRMETDPTQYNTNDDLVNIPGFTPYVMHTVRVVAFDNKVDFFMDDMITPKDTIHQDSADRPPIGDLYVFLGAVKQTQQNVANVLLQNVVYTIIRHETLAPMESSTTTPTGNPTESPTLEPTMTPTITPTNNPTTSKPTESPSYAHASFTTDTLKAAVDLWTSNRPAAMAEHGPIKDWNTSLVTSFFKLFQYKDSFNDDISLWDASSVTTMSQMFRATSFNIDISQWNVGKVTTMYAMFRSATLFNKDISLWDTSSVTTMAHMFREASFNTDISQWNVDKVTTMYAMFRDSSSFGQKLCWDLSGETDIAFMFDGSSGSIGCD